MARFTAPPVLAFSLALFAVAQLGCAAAAAQESEPLGLFERMFAGSERVGAPQNGAAPAAGGRIAQLGGSDLLVRLDRLEAQIRQLTGALEQLQYRNQQLESQLRRMQESADQRPQDAARALPPRNPNLMPAAPAVAAPAAPGQPGRRGDAFDPTQHPNAPGAPHVLGSMGA